MGKLSFEKTKWIFVPANARDNEHAIKYGLQWDAVNLRWFTRNIFKAKSLRQFADRSAELKLKNNFFTDYKLPEQIEYPDHLSPKPFQLESAKHILTRSPAYCADEAGLGKTITATLCMNARPGFVLVICPAYLKYNWQKEIQTWSKPKRDVIIWGEDDKPSDHFKRVLIVPDSIIAKPDVRAYLNSYCNFTWMFIDEAHRFKEASAQRTKAVIDIASSTGACIVLMSGTPLPNKARELYPLLGSLAAESIGHLSEKDFLYAYGDPKKISFPTPQGVEYRTTYDGISNGKTLGHMLNKKLMIRHLKKNVLKLKDKQRQIIFIDEPKKLQKLGKDILRQVGLDEILGDDYSLGDVATYRKESGLAMLNAATEFIRDILESSPEPLVVFAYHIDVVEGLTNALQKYNPIKVRGGMSANLKQTAVDMFQKNKQHRLIILNIDSGSVGITLTRAKRGVAVEFSWTPGINSQMEDRIHRITQTEQVLWQYLVMRGGLSERMLWKVLDKQDGIDVVLS